MGQARCHKKCYQETNLQRGPRLRNWLAFGAYVIRLRSGFAKKQFPSASSDHLKQAVREELCQLMAKVVPPGGHAPQPGLPK